MDPMNNSAYDYNAQSQHNNNPLLGELLFGKQYQYQRELEKMGFENQFNASQAQINRDWQEYMSSTAYQRATQDLKNAGLNPALAYQQGGASTPGGYSATSGSGSTGSGMVKSGFASALALAARIAFVIGSKNATSAALNVQEALTLNGITSAYSRKNAVAKFDEVDEWHTLQKSRVENNRLWQEYLSRRF